MWVVHLARIAGQEMTSAPDCNQHHLLAFHTGKQDTNCAAPATARCNLSGTCAYMASASRQLPIQTHLCKPHTVPHLFPNAPAKSELWAWLPPRSSRRAVPRTYSGRSLQSAESVDPTQDLKNNPQSYPEAASESLCRCRRKPPRCLLLQGSSASGLATVT